MLASKHDMKHLLITTIAAVLLVGCGESQQSAPPVEVKPVEPVAEAAQPEPTTAKAPDISIHEAASSGNIVAVKKHLAAGADVNAKTGEETPLHFAALFGRKEIAEMLIAKGADVNAKDEFGYAPLHHAAWNGRTEIAELFIAAGADVNAKDGWEWTPLHIAAGKSHKEIIELLIGKGADVNALNNKGDTPLDLAMPDSPFDSTELADLLRKHGGKTGEELKAEGK